MTDIQQIAYAYKNLKQTLNDANSDEPAQPPITLPLSPMTSPLVWVPVLQKHFAPVAKLPQTTPPTS